MKRTLFAKFLIPVFIILLLLLAVYEVSQSQTILPTPKPVLHPTETRLPNCVPYPSRNTAVYPSTATPFPGQQISDSAVVSVTPLPIAHIYDLSPNSKAIDKDVVVVFRCDGTYVQFLTGPGVQIPQDLHLNAGDTIINGYPLAAHPIPPPRPQYVTSTPVVTSNAVISITPSNPTQVPYPYPSVYP